jgi:uncharacterized protein (DUF4415 family)
MPRKFEPFTREELAEIERRRAVAREIARASLETIDPEEEARLTKAAEEDPDNPPLTDEDWSRMRPAHEVVPHLVAKSLRGRPKLEAPKEQVTLRLDPDVLAHFRARGRGWQTAINETLRRAIETGT